MKLSTALTPRHLRPGYTPPSGSKRKYLIITWWVGTIAGNVARAMMAAKIRELQDERGETKRRLDKLRDDYAILRRDAVHLQDTTLSHSNTMHEQIRALNEQLNAQIENEHAVVQNKDNYIAELKELVRRKEEALAGQTYVHQSEKDVLRAEITHLHEINDRLAQEPNQEQEIGRLKALLMEANGEITRLNLMLDESERELLTAKDVAVRAATSPKLDEAEQRTMEREARRNRA